MIGPFAGRMQYLCNGSASSFPFTFPILAASDLVVTRRDASGADSTLRLGVDYAVPAECVGAAGGGRVVLLGGAPPSGCSLTIERRVPVTQPTDLRSQAAYPAEEIETALDRLTMIAQQVVDGLGGGEGSGRVLRLGDADVDGAGAYRARANRIADLADPVSATDAATLGTVQRAVLSALAGHALVLPRAWRATGDGTTTVYGLAGAPLAAAEAYLVIVGGVAQDPETDYVVDVAAEQIRFDAAPPLGARIVVRCVGYALPCAAPPVYTTATLPAAGPQYAGQAVLLIDAGEAAQELVCLPAQDGSYGWCLRAVGGASIA